VVKHVRIGQGRTIRETGKQPGPGEQGWMPGAAHAHSAHASFCRAEATQEPSHSVARLRRQGASDTTATSAACRKQ